MKITFSVGMLVLIFRKVFAREGAADLLQRISNLHWGWIVLAVGMQLAAIGCATFRWKTLLGGQGIRPSWRFLASSIMIARYWGAFTPGGFTGFGGWRIYDVAKHTGKTARAAATIGVETLLGQAAFGVVVMSASMYGSRFLGTDGVLLVNLFFAGIVAIAFVLLTRPRLFRFFATFLPRGIRLRVQTLIDAVCAYEGKGTILLRALVLGVGVHAFNNLIYVCAARALGVELGVGEVFFASSLQIFMTLLPASINGMGLREGTAIALYTSPAIGLSLSVAVLIPVLGFACEMFVSSFGWLIYLFRGEDYAPHIEVDELETEEEARAAIEEVPRNQQPRPWRGCTIGLGAGAVAGLIVGIAEAVVIVLSGKGSVGIGVVAYGALAYGMFCAGVGAFFGWGLAYSGRLMKRPAMSEPLAYARLTAFLVAVFALALGAFRVRRDVFHEELVWKSLPGLGVFCLCLLAAVVLYVGLSAFFRWILVRKPGRFMLRAWGSPAFVGIAVGALCIATLVIGKPAEARERLARGQAPQGAGNVLFLVVDTLRADHLPQYGYEAIETPALDAFSRDAIRFNMAFANASWTRPSFASILSGRFPSSHSVMEKNAALPDEVTTMPEVFRAAGWDTRGIATNYNVTPYYNFDQGFDRYEYLEPNFVLGADDAAAKLLLIQSLKRVIEKVNAVAERVEPGSAYQDAKVVNERVFEWLDESVQGPWFYFVGYMDPHDPYYPHPYDGTGYSRAAHQRPDPSEASRLIELYDGEIEYWDSQLGQLLDELKRRGLYDELTIVLTSDHGEEFCDHGGFWHGTTLYDEQIRVPLFIKLPNNQRGGTSVGHWTQSVDLMPTLLRLFGVDIPAEVQGGDVFEGTDVVYAEESHEGNILESVRERRGTDEWKLIRANPGNRRGLEPTELYRVDFDPLEQDNRVAEMPNETEEMMNVLESQRDFAREGAIDGVAVELTDEDIEKKCSLGYWSPEDCCARGFIQYCE